MLKCGLSKFYLRIIMEENMNKNDLVIVTPKNFYNKKYNEEFIKK